MNKDPVILLSLGSTLYEYSSIHNVDCVDVTFLFTGKNDPSLLSTKYNSTLIILRDSEKESWKEKYQIGKLKY